MGKEMDKFTERMIKWKEAIIELEKVESNYNEVASYIDENPAINILGRLLNFYISTDRINDIEAFVNNAVISLSKTKEFKVHDLSINEKIRPFRAFIGHVLPSNLPPRAVKTEERNRTGYYNTLSSKVSTSLMKSRDMTPDKSNTKLVMQTPSQSNMPTIFKAQNVIPANTSGAKGINIIRTPQRQASISKFQAQPTSHFAQQKTPKLFENQFPMKWYNQ